MLRFARETRLSETTFVQSARTDRADYRNRIWTIAEEIPFAGHPSLGTAVAVARRRGEPSARYVQEVRAGRQPIDVELQGDRATASMLQNPAEFGDELDHLALVRALGLGAEGADTELPAQLVSTGLPTALIPVKQNSLERAVPDFEALACIEGVPPEANFYVFDCSEAWSPLARMFTTMVEGGEDPATGSAAGPLCAYLHRYAGCREIEITQGVEMGRPSILRARVDGDRVRVGGDVVTIVEGTLTL
jgi:trans-2,3-dihydro-3-hydroxyanthranilate isomerase